LTQSDSENEAVQEVPNVGTLTRIGRSHVGRPKEPKMLKKTLLLAIILLTMPFVPASAQNFEVTSPDIVGGHITQKFILKGFGCTGDNVSPALKWKHPPAGTKSFAVMVHDQDAPTGGAGFWHWVVVNIPAGTRMLTQGAGDNGGFLPVGALQIPTDFGVPGWGGPCPPSGDQPHRYTFTVYALKVEKLKLPPDATASLTGFMVHMNMISKAFFVVTYGR
jgi:Raf kinase inhibitor-like YbhB/YbcL family protein